MDLRELAAQGSAPTNNGSPVVQVVGAPYAAGCEVTPSYGPTPNGTVLFPGQLNSLCVMELNLATGSHAIGLGATNAIEINDLVARAILPALPGYVAPIGDVLYINEWSESQSWLMQCITFNFSGTGAEGAMNSTQVWVSSKNAARPLDACKPQRVPVACSPCVNGFTVSYSFPFYIGQNNGIAFTLPADTTALVTMNIAAYSGPQTFVPCSGM